MTLGNKGIPLRAPLLSKLTRVIGAYPEVLSAYLFGSTATGHAGEESDVDIAVRLAPGLSAEKRFQLRLELMDRIEKMVDSLPGRQFSQGMLFGDPLGSPSGLSVPWTSCL